MESGCGDLGSSTAPLTWHDFLERMRQPSAADFVKSIKSFIVTFSNKAPDLEKDSDAVQEFLADMEDAFRAHKLWAGSSEEELESAGEGLEKYVMTKLFNRVFASVPEDVNSDEQLFEKMALLQQFVRPENLEIKPAFHNETSWLANPPQLHSNLLYIQRYRRKSRLVSEAAYFFTNILSAETFIWNIDAQALSMDEIEFQKKMNCAREHLLGLSTNSENPVSQTKLDGTQKTEEILKTNRLSDCYLPAIRQQNNSNQANEVSMNLGGQNILIPRKQSVSDLENKGSSDLLKDDHLIRYFQQYPFLYARAGDLSVEDVENLLNCYKKLVLKYISLSKGMGVINESLPGQNMQMLSKTETLKEFDDAKVLGINSEKDEGIYREDDVSIENLLSGGDDSETKRTSGGLVDNPSAEREKEVCP
ncbi:vacuolar protein sorting-associated protein 9A-like isoform X2 [Ananas comosus]|uniref:Vacuolar protein sorting-associated protein 9A-like isoform X2 n=1 Tax=Ananas comosus TaxID=4615 RepID=A0A6P5FVE5_ANACO|nr:vacuolar protein sorting-associated protein 9A-like isoform X2 [Ananas comosus]